MEEPAVDPDERDQGIAHGPGSSATLETGTAMTPEQRLEHTEANLDRLEAVVAPLASSAAARNSRIETLLATTESLNTTAVDVKTAINK